MEIVFFCILMDLSFKWNTHTSVIVIQFHCHFHAMLCLCLCLRMLFYGTFVFNLSFTLHIIEHCDLWIVKDCQMHMFLVSWMGFLLVSRFCYCFVIGWTKKKKKKKKIFLSFLPASSSETLDILNLFKFPILEMEIP